MNNSDTALVIGGTGMLHDATCWLAERSDTVVLVSRRASRFRCDTGNVLAVDADWNDGSFQTRVSAALDRTTTIRRALLWLHDPEPILRWLVPRLSSARVVVMLGSMDGATTRIETRSKVASVRLGSIRTAAGRRWLTHAEISQGAIAVLKSGRSADIGDLSPIA